MGPKLLTQALQDLGDSFARSEVDSVRLNPEKAGDQDLDARHVSVPRAGVADLYQAAVVTQEVERARRGNVIQPLLAVVTPELSR
jgi:hypothetical protein